MTPLSPALCRRIDRRARRAHRFHRHAHHPLCAAYAGEVVRLGRRTRLCRGCLLSAVGGVVGLAAGTVAPRLAAAALAAALVAALPLAAWAVRARVGAPRPKLVTRAAPLAIAGCLLAEGLRGGAAGWVVAGSTAAAVVAARAAYRRRTPDRSACAACPERALPRACSGFAPILRREAALSRLAGRWIATERAAAAATHATRERRPAGGQRAAARPGG